MEKGRKRREEGQAGERRGTAGYKRERESRKEGEARDKQRPHTNGAAECEARKKKVTATLTTKRRRRWTPDNSWDRRQATEKTVGRPAKRIDDDESPSA